MATLRRRVVLLGLFIALAGVPAFAPSATAATTRVDCSASYVSANLPWGHKCLRAGEFCKVGNRAYLRFGFVCPSSGHLKRR